MTPDDQVPADVNNPVEPPPPPTAGPAAFGRPVPRTVPGPPATRFDPNRLTRMDLSRLAVLLSAGAVQGRVGGLEAQEVDRLVRRGTVPVPRVAPMTTFGRSWVGRGPVPTPPAGPASDAPDGVAGPGTDPPHAAA